MRYESEMRYHRLMMFRETMSTTGQCFVILMGTSAEFEEFHYNGLTIGHVISIVEPEFKSNYLSESYDLPIVATRVPFDCARAHIADVPSNVIILPRSGCTTSFRRMGVTLEFQGAVFDDTDCVGTMCDRQKKLCSCVYSDHKKFTYVVKVRVKMDGFDECIDFQSLQLTKMIVSTTTVQQVNIDVLKQLATRRAMRDQLRKLVAHVNCNGGWNIVGWVRTGEKVDLADGTSKVASDTSKPHIVHLEPKRSNLDLNPFMFAMDNSCDATQDDDAGAQDQANAGAQDQPTR